MEFIDDLKLFTLFTSDSEILFSLFIVILCCSLCNNLDILVKVFSSISQKSMLCTNQDIGVCWNLSLIFKYTSFQM